MAEEPSDRLTLTKADVSQRVHETLGLSNGEARTLVDTLLEVIKDELITGSGQLKVSGFGTFAVRTKNARVGRNPRTREEFPITRRCVLVFHPSTTLRDRLNRSE